MLVNVCLLYVFPAPTTVAQIAGFSSFRTEKYSTVYLYNVWLMLGLITHVGKWEESAVDTGRQVSLQQHFLSGNTQYKDYWTTPFLTFWGSSILLSFIEIVYIPPTVCKEIQVLLTLNISYSIIHFNCFLLLLQLSRSMQIDLNI